MGTVSFDGPDGRPILQVHAPVTRISLQHAGFDADRDASANIGLGILRQVNLTFDYARQQIILEPNHLYGRKDVFNRAGLRLQRRDAGWIVTAVYPVSPAVEAGVHPGDTVATVDGQGPDRLTAEGLAGKLTGGVGTRLTLRLGTQAAGRTVSLVLRDIL